MGRGPVLGRAWPDVLRVVAQFERERPEIGTAWEDCHPSGDRDAGGADLREVLAGLDVGTTSVKAVLMTAEGHEVGTGRAPMKWSRTRYGVEIDAATLADSALDALRVALDGLDNARVVSIRVSSMAESGVLVDGADAPLGPVIAWHDTRDSPRSRAPRLRNGPDEFSRRTGLPFRSQWSLTRAPLATRPRAVRGWCRTPIQRRGVGCPSPRRRAGNGALARVPDGMAGSRERRSLARGVGVVRRVRRWAR